MISGSIWWQGDELCAFEMHPLSSAWFVINGQGKKEY
jgi:hypothetical protein